MVQKKKNVKRMFRIKNIITTARALSDSLAMLLEVRKYALSQGVDTKNM